jgi:methyl-accepting chemotaxis protein
MKHVKGSSERTISVIRVIDEIAFQTNILALNAAVEADRPGVAVTGLARAGDEAHNLAEGRATAARDTAALIEQSIARQRGGNRVSAHLAQGEEASKELAVQAQRLYAVLEGVRRHAEGLFEQRVPARRSEMSHSA